MGITVVQCTKIQKKIQKKVPKSPPKPPPQIPVCNKQGLLTPFFGVLFGGFWGSQWLGGVHSEFQGFLGGPLVIQGFLVFSRWFLGVFLGEFSKSSAGPAYFGGVSSCFLVFSRCFPLGFFGVSFSAFGEFQVNFSAGPGFFVCVFPDTF